MRELLLPLGALLLLSATASAFFWPPYHKPPDNAVLGALRVQLPI